MKNATHFVIEFHEGTNELEGCATTKVARVNEWLRRIAKTCATAGGYNKTYVEVWNNSTKIATIRVDVKRDGSASFKEHLRHYGIAA